MKRFKNILLLMNDMDEPNSAFRQAVTLATNNQAKLTVYEVIEDFSDFNQLLDHILPQDVMDNIVTEKFRHIEELVVTKGQQLEIDIRVGHGRVFFEVVTAVLQDDFDLVIKACQQHGSLRTMMFGTTDMHLLRKCPCPLWLIKPHQETKYHRILAAIDIEPSADPEGMDTLNQQILEMAASLALSEPAELHIVHAWTIFGENLLKASFFAAQKEEFAAWIADQNLEIKSRLNVFQHKLASFLDKQDSSFIKPKVHFIEGDAGEIIPQLAEEKKIDLVIMGTVARTGLPGFIMGNTAESILNQLNCSVLAIKPTGFVSPITLKQVTP